MTMTTYNAPHDAMDETKLAGMVEAIRRGEVLPPIVVHGYDALTGSHRIAAYAEARRLADLCETDEWNNADLDCAIVEVEDDEYSAALASLGLGSCDEIGDYNEFCAALYDACDDPGVRAALADQR